MAKTKGKKTKKEVEEVVEDEEDLELEDLEEDGDDDDEDEDEAPKKKKAKKQEVVFGASDLAALLAEKTGQNINARGLRVLLRKMARDGRINREVTAGNRTRYNWSGPNDPEVKKIIKAVEGGEIEEGKKEALAKLKKDKASKTETPAKKKGKGKKAKKEVEPEPVEEDDDEEFEDDDDE